MATVQASQEPAEAGAAAAPAEPIGPQLRKSARLAGKVYIFNTPSTRKKRDPNERFHIYEIYDRDAADSEWYWIKWHDYRAERHDTAQHRDRLVEDGCGALCDYVDAFKVWQEDEPDEERTFAAYKKLRPNKRVFTADTNGRCYIASLECAAALVGVENYLPDGVVAAFFLSHPEVEEQGVTWQRLTQLMQLANAVKRKGGAEGMCFRGKRSETNLVRQTLSGCGPACTHPRARCVPVRRCHRRGRAHVRSPCHS